MNLIVPIIFSVFAIVAIVLSRQIEREPNAGRPWNSRGGE